MGINSEAIEQVIKSTDFDSSNEYVSALKITTHFLKIKYEQLLDKYTKLKDKYDKLNKQK